MIMTTDATIGKTPDPYLLEKPLISKVFQKANPLKATMATTKANSPGLKPIIIFKSLSSRMTNPLVWQGSILFFSF
jgi:hypothetical protein